MTGLNRVHTVDVANLRRRHPIQDVVAAAGVQLQSTGRAWMGCCPFHQDRTASLSVAGVPDRFHCFGCGASGDVIDFISRLHQLGFRDAVDLLEGTTASRMPPTPLPPAHTAPGTHPSQPSEITAERGLQVNALAWQWFCRPAAHDFATNYLRRHRGIDLRHAETQIGHSLVGHTGHGWTHLIEHLQARGVTDDELLRLDLAQPNRQGALIDTLRDRLIVPVTTATGDITGFVGRDTSGHPRAPKYRNPTHTVTFDKSTCLYLPTAATEPDTSLIIVEGPLDALAITATAATAGLTGQVTPCSTLGTTVSAAQAGQVLTLATTPPIIALDADDAGARGTLRWVEAICRDRGTPALIACLPERLDPADLLSRHGAQGLSALLPTHRHAGISGPAGHPLWLRQPGRELALLACRDSQPSRALITDLLRLEAQLPYQARVELFRGAVAEMTRQGWNPDRAFSRALVRSLSQATSTPTRDLPRTPDPLCTPDPQ